MWSVTIGNALLVYRELKDKEFEKMKFKLLNTEIIIRCLGSDAQLINSIDNKTKNSTQNNHALLADAGFDFE